MTPDELRAAFPDWFGEFDPGYPAWDDLYNDADGPVVGGAQIARDMAAITGDQSWLPLAGSLNAMIDRAQVAYHREYRDWLQRNAPEGSRWRPHQRLSRNYAGQPEGPVHDYGDMAGIGWENLPSWQEVYDEEHMKPVAATGERRRKDGIIEAGLGDFPQRRIGTVPFYPAFHMANDWWQTHREAPFHPNFEACTIMPEHFAAQATSPHARAWALEITIADLNAAARFWQLVCGQVDYLLQDEDDLGRLERNRIFRVAGLIANRQYRHASRARK